jgi:hypothetical protein
MRRPVRWILLGVGLAAAAAAAVPLVKIGPRNLWGMLRYDQREAGDLRVGQKAPDVVLTALDGSRVRLGERLGQRPFVLVFGSYT